MAVAASPSAPARGSVGAGRVWKNQGPAQSAQLGSSSAEGEGAPSPQPGKRGSLQRGGIPKAKKDGGEAFFSERGASRPPAYSPVVVPSNYRSSRLIVRNIPPFVKTDALRKHFEEAAAVCGEPSAAVTDCALKTTADGRSRQIGFVGFETEAAAAAVRQRLNGTYLYTRKLAVDFALPRSLALKPLPHGRLSEKGSKEEASAAASSQAASSRVTRKAGVAEKATHAFFDDDEVGDEAWLAAAKAANSTATPPHPGEEGSSAKLEENAASCAAACLREDADLSEGRLLVRNLPFSANASDIQALAAASGEVSRVLLLRDRENQRFLGAALIEFVFPEHAALALERLDGLIFKGRILNALPAKPRPAPETSEGRRKATSSFKRSQELRRRREVEASEKEQQPHQRSWNLLFASANAATDAALSALGSVEDSAKRLLLDGAQKQSAAATATLAEALVLRETKAWVEREGVVLGALERTGADLRSAVFKGKAAAEDAERASDTLIVKHLPVAQVEASSLRALFSRFGEMARFCLAPTRTLLLVQYLSPAAATAALKALSYRPYKNSPLYIERAPVPVFKEHLAEKRAANSEAKAALRSAEIAAAGEGSAAALSAEEEAEAEAEAEARGEREGGKAASAGRTHLAEGEKESAADGQSEEGHRLERKAASEDEEEADAESEAAGRTSLFVKNLSFKTTQEGLESCFSVCEGFRSAKLMTRLRPTRKGEKPERLSMGFAFVEFANAESAMAAAKKMQGLFVDGHLISVTLAKPKRRDGGAPSPNNPSKSSKGSATGKRESSSKVVVKNLAFEASEKDLRELFAPFGEVVSVRIPRNITGGSRGFAFVRFRSAAEAKTAMEALERAHLYGRHLVLQFAEDSVQETPLLSLLAKKSGSQEASDEEAPKSVGKAASSEETQIAEKKDARRTARANEANRKRRRESPQEARRSLFKKKRKETASV